MNKNLITIAILFVINVISIDASNLPNNRLKKAYKENYNQFDLQNPVQGVSLLDQMHSNYASHVDNQSKLQWINSVLDNANITIEEKINQLELLDKIIAADISLHSGWFWNSPEDQVQIDWLSERQETIQRNIAELQWQAKSFGYKATVKAAKYASIYLGIILAAYLAKDQYAKLSGDQSVLKYSYGDLAAMPITKIIELASSATLGTFNALTGPTAQSMLSNVYNSALAIGQKGYSYAAEAAKAISTKVPAALQENIHDIAATIAENTIPKKYSAYIDIPDQF